MIQKTGLVLIALMGMGFSLAANAKAPSPNPTCRDVANVYKGAGYTCGCGLFVSCDHASCVGGDTILHLEPGPSGCSAISVLRAS